jgi:hypothetical protein
LERRRREKLNLGYRHSDEEDRESGLVEMRKDVAAVESGF